MYSQPCDFNFAAMKSACALVCASVTVVAKQSQLFQPIGGVLAHDQNAGSAARAESKRTLDAMTAAKSFWLKPRMMGRIKFLQEVIEKFCRFNVPLAIPKTDDAPKFFEIFGDEFARKKTGNSFA